MATEKFQFTSADGHMLAASLDLPNVKPVAYALLAHCFTCGKDVLAARRISERLTEHGIATLRFDFTGLGDSEGEFANSTFSSNIDDLVKAADHMRENNRAVSILIGHSLGGAAILAAAARISDAKCIATIAAPSDPAHVTGLFKDSVETIQKEGELEVSLSGRPFTIKREFLEDIKEHMLTKDLAELHKPLMIFHSPTDDYVGIDNATRLFIAAKHPKNFVSLAGADHLLSKKPDAYFVADMIATWAGRYLHTSSSTRLENPADGVVVVQETRAGQYQQIVAVGEHRLIADEPADVGGLGSGLGPYDLLLAGLGACTSMTMRMYAQLKKIPLDRVTVKLKHSRIYAKDCENCETQEGQISQITRNITIEGNLDDAQRAKLMEIADKCPVHRTLTHEIDIVTKAE